MKKKLVIVGNGMAGVRCAEKIVEKNRNLYEIVIIGKEPFPNYNRIMLSSILQKKTTVDEIKINDWDWYKENNITLYTGENVTEILREKKAVVTEKGRVIEYDKLIMATGSNSFILPLPGHQLEGVVGFRTIDDVEMMVNIAKKYKKAVVIGGGLLGLEAARGLMDRGMEVHVVHLLPTLMEQQLDQAASNLLKSDLEKQGMNFLMEKQTKEIYGENRVEGITFADGSFVECDLVVMAVGIRSNVAIAKEAGLEVNRSIVVNDYMETSDPSIYAVGECAEHRGIAYGLVAPLYEQALILAHHLTNIETKGYQGSILSTQLKVAGCDLFSGGQIHEDEQTKAIIVHDQIDGVYKKVLVREEKIVGVLLYGDASDGPRLFNMLKKETNVKDYLNVSLFHKPGEGNGLNIDEMSADEMVCNCNGVTKGHIVEAILEQETKTVDEIKKVTKAGSSCGGCKGMIAAILAHTLGEPLDEAMLTSSDDKRECKKCGTIYGNDDQVGNIKENLDGQQIELQLQDGTYLADYCSCCRRRMYVMSQLNVSKDNLYDSIGTNNMSIELVGEEM